MLLALLAVRRWRLISAGAEDARWAPKHPSAKAAYGGQPSGVACAPSSAGTRVSAHFAASSLARGGEAGAGDPNLRPGSGFGLARAGSGSGMWPPAQASATSSGRITTPFSSVPAGGSSTVNLCQTLAAGRSSPALRRAESLSCSPGSSGRSGSDGTIAALQSVDAGEAWRFGGASGDELIAFSDLQFSRCIGQVRSMRIVLLLAVIRLHLL